MNTLRLRIIHYRYYYSNSSYNFHLIILSPGNWTKHTLAVNTWPLIHGGKELKSFYFNEWASFIAQKKKVFPGLTF